MFPTSFKWRELQISRSALKVVSPVFPPRSLTLPGQVHKALLDTTSRGLPEALLHTAVFGALSTSLGSEKTKGPMGPYPSAMQSSSQGPALCFRPSGFQANLL